MISSSDAGLETTQSPSSGQRSAPLRLAYVVDTLVTGGAERLVLTFAETVRNRSDIDLTVFVLNDGETPFLEQLKALGTQVVLLPGRNLVDAKRFVRLVKAMRSHKIEYVHAHLASSTTLGSFAAFLLRLPFVTTIHNVRPSVRRIRLTRKILSWIGLRLPGVKIIAVGEAVSEALQEKEGKRDCIVVPNAVSETVVATSGAGAAVRAELGLSSDTVALVCIGTIIPQKAHEVLIEAFARVRDVNENAVLLIVGDPRDPEIRKSLGVQAQTLGVAEHVKYLGMRSDIPQVLAASDIFVSSSDWEGAPVSLLEAMANGVPAVVTEVGENAVVLDNTGAILVPTRAPDALADGVIKLTEDKELFDKVSVAVQERALGTYGAEAWAERLLEFYASTGRRRDWRDARAQQEGTI